MRCIKLLAGVGLVILLNACASMYASQQLAVTFVSDPIGATIYSGNQARGYAPIVLNYEPTQDFLNGGCMLLAQAEAVWASGARLNYPNIRACKAMGLSQTFTFSRPDVPGREVDANFALQLQYNRNQQQQQRERDDSACQLIYQQAQAQAIQMYPMPQETGYCPSCGALNAMTIVATQQARNNYAQTAYKNCMGAKGWR
ncbi:MAG: hypothetical protein WCF09_11825 [Gallionella sp.]